jgi:hypothetical protein
MMSLNDEIDEKHAGDEAAGSRAESMLNQAEAELEVTLSQWKDVESPNLEALIEWYQKSKYLDRLRKNFLGIEEI